MGIGLGTRQGRRWLRCFSITIRMGIWTFGLADDGDTLKVYRNDTEGDEVRFVSIEEEMGVDAVGAWMGFALGDYDSDEDLDIFITNIGYHFLLYDVPPVPSGDCAYSHAQGWWYLLPLSAAE